MDPTGKTAWLNRIVCAIVNARDFLCRHLENQAILRQISVKKTEAQPRVGQFTGKNAAVARVEAAVAVLERAALLALRAARARRRTDGRRGLAAVARGRLRGEVGRAVAAVVGLADKQRARDVARLAQVGEHDTVLVQLRTRDRGRLCDPALSVARRGAVWRLDCAEAERSALGEAAARAASDNDLCADGALLEDKRRLRLFVDERQRLAFAVGVEIAWQSKARFNRRNAVALGRCANLLRLEERDGIVAQNETERVCALYTVVVELSET